MPDKMASVPIQLYQVLVKGLDTRLHQLNPPIPLRLTVDAEPVLVRPHPTSALYAVTYRLGILDAHSHDVATIDVTLVALCEVAAASTTRDLEIYLHKTLMPVLHEHIREIAHDVSRRLGIPPLVIDVYRHRRIKLSF